MNTRSSRLDGFALVGERLLFDQVLHTAWCEGRVRIVLMLGRQSFPEPAQGAMEVIQIEHFTAGDAAVLMPTIGGENG
jgi:hypothetical protein